MISPECGHWTESSETKGAGFWPPFQRAFANIHLRPKILPPGSFKNQCRRQRIKNEENREPILRAVPGFLRCGDEKIKIVEKILPHTVSCMDKHPA